MGKTSQKSVKYVIKAELDASGIVEKPDIVGAIFGQTEGLLGDDLDLRELQEKGRVGRIQVHVKKENGSSKAKIRIPSSLDSADTSLLAASLETIERVGPTDAEIQVDEVKDQRTSKRDYIAERAKELLRELENDAPERSEITQDIKKELRTEQIGEYKGFRAGPEAENSEEVILVEGKADLINLLERGVKNAVAIGGTSIPDTIKELAEEKQITAFVDGDRGGEMIVQELRQKADLQNVARAPETLEVEELTSKQLHSALRDRKPAERFEAQTN